MHENQAPTAKRLVLSLLSAPALEQVGIGLLVKWGELFAIDAATMRVTVGRLVRQRLLSSPERGVYRIGPEGKLIAETARDWVNAETRIGPWRGEWLLIHCAHLGRANRSALRARERAFRLTGLSEFVSGLWLRPANLSEPVAATRARLVELGLEAEAILALATEIPGVGEKELFELWPRKQIEAAYRQHLAAMKTSTRNLKKLSLAQAAKETIEVGEAVIRQINGDPLLPDSMIDGRARRDMISQMIRYDEIGREIWRRFIDESEH